MNNIDELGIFKEECDELTNLLLKLSGGTCTDDLSPNEIELLKREFGDDWYKN